eukprot:CAMPEP_0180793438 /NCGR_PEP_ID=MMETSP1038_2-20121128/54997_1 /TAXON_ID=632150 /ORGANISM="Azadinium spinosum, Strain 3D9" /LENGTH=105 /DNA_ID=CAMNT_0022831953 /DNA_START=39 /DNA_END=354 /DNA_ORIENTATION=-
MSDSKAHRQKSSAVSAWALGTHALLSGTRVPLWRGGKLHKEKTERRFSLAYRRHCRHRVAKQTRQMKMPQGIQIGDHIVEAWRGETEPAGIKSLCGITNPTQQTG